MTQKTTATGSSASTRRAVGWIRTGHATISVMGHGLMLFALGLAQIPIVLLLVVGIALGLGLGLIFLFPPLVGLTRRWVRRARHLSQKWSGIEIEEPYHPEPPPPVPQWDGWYRDGRSLYKTPRIPAFNRRLNWVLKDPATWRDLAWLVCYPISGGLIAVAPVGLLLYGILLIAAWRPVEVAAGVVIMVGGLLLAPRVPRLYGLWNALLLGPTESARLARQVHRLTRSRTDAVDAQSAELHRIERDLHDGAQARLVAMGMTLGAAEQLIESDPSAARALIAKTREASSATLAELRHLIRGILPPVLAERGLGDAVRAMALDSPLDVTVTVDLPARPAPPVESAAYFAVSELLTNATRHSGAREVLIDISHRGSALRITVTDDGSGGADPSRGTGLRGLERRLAAFDGVLALSSPPGGPTVAIMDLPEALPELPPAIPPLPRWKRLMMGVCWGLFWLPLFPQGIVALIFKLVGTSEGTWFLALYLPDPLSWVTIILLILLGVVMLITGVRLGAQTIRRDPLRPGC
ncbi:MAG TPA: histidine kinase [Thermopolyspora sp.]|jgi:Signal transduction histidine kinase